MDLALIITGFANRWIYLVAKKKSIYYENLEIDLI